MGSRRAVDLFLYFGLVIAYFLANFYSVSASVTLPAKAETLGMSALLVGFVSSLYYYTYGAMQPVCGALNDRYGPLRVVAFGMLLSGIGSFLFVFAEAPWVLGLSRLLCGLGLAPVFSGVLVFQSRVFRLERQPLVLVVSLTAGNLGAVAAVAPLRWTLERWGSSTVFSFLSLLCFVLAAGLISGSIEKAPVEVRKTSGKLSVISHMKQGFALIAGSPQLVIITLLWSIEYASYLVLQGLWLVFWFRQTYRIPTKTAAVWSTLMAIGAMAGTLACARGSAHPKRLRFDLVLSSALFGLSWCALEVGMAFRLPVAFCGLSGFFIGALCGVGIVQLALAVNLTVAKQEVGVVVGVVNLLVFVAVIVYQLATGALLTHFPGNRPGTYSPIGYTFTFALVLFSVLLGVASAFLLKPFGEKTSSLSPLRAEREKRSDDPSIVVDK